MKRIVWILLAGMFVAPCRVDAQIQYQRFEFEQNHMGTRFRLVCYALGRDQAQHAADEAFARVAFLDRTMSDYQATSELMQLCAKNATEACEAQKVSPELFFVLDQARQVSEMSEGAFDVTIGPVVQLWRHARRTQRLPDAKELAAARAKVDYRNLVLDAEARTVRFKIPGIRLDLGGIAKGYAADEMLRICREKHLLTSCLAAAGGDVAVSNAPPGKDGWRIDIEPLPGSKTRRTLLLKNAAVSTSGDSQQFVVIDGVRYSHIVDPRTGLGLTGSRLVSVIAPKGIQSDPLTKLAAVLPPEKAFPLLEKIDDVAACLVWKTAEGEQSRISKRFDSYLVPAE